MNGPLSAALLAMGAAWGLSHPLTKIAATGGLTPLGMVFWQLLIGAVALGLVLRQRLQHLRWTRATIAFWLMIALIGTIVPNWAGFVAIRHLPAGLVSVLMSLIPLIAFPVALMLGNELFAWRRLGGLILGFVGVLFIVVPEGSLPNGTALIFLPLAIVGPVCYAFEGNIVARWGTRNMDALQVLFGASLIGAVISGGLAWSQGQLFMINPAQLPGQALLGSSLIHVVVYTSYVWMVGKAGPVFAVQVSYAVTAAGVIWAMALLGERFGPGFWIALALIFAGVALVQPRRAGDSLPPKPTEI